MNFSKSILLALLGFSLPGPSSAILAAQVADAKASGNGQENSSKGTRLILLGTSGGPTVHAGRSQPASLLVVDGHPYLIDCGDGTVRQLKRAGFDAADIAHAFLTHLHFDHVGDASSLMLFNWVSGERQPLAFHGPPGTKAFISSALGYLSLPEMIYSLQLPPHPDIKEMVSAEDIVGKGPKVVFQDYRVKVTAVENSHYGLLALDPQSYGVTKSFSYRFDTPDRSIVFTGDTGPSKAVEELAAGADILVSEVIDIAAVERFLKANNKVAADKLNATIAHMREEHLAPEEVGKIAARAGVKLVVLSHIAPGNDNQKDSLAFTTGVRKFFQGPVVAGADLDQF